MHICLASKKLLRITGKQRTCAERRTSVVTDKNNVFQLGLEETAKDTYPSRVCIDSGFECAWVALTRNAQCPLLVAGKITQAPSYFVFSYLRHRGKYDLSVDEARATPRLPKRNTLFVIAAWTCASLSPGTQMLCYKITAHPSAFVG